MGKESGGVAACAIEEGCKCKNEVAFLDYFKCWERRVRKYYNKYRDFYTANALDYKDIRQDLLLNIWGVMNKYQEKPKEELEKILNATIKHRLLVLARGHKRFIGNELSEEELLNKENMSTVLRYLSIEDMVTNGMDFPLCKSVPNLIPTLKEVLSPEDFRIIEDKFLMNRTLREMGEDYNRSGQWMAKRYRLLLALLRKRMSETDLSIKLEES